MLYTHAGPIPEHQYVYIQPDSLGDHGWLPGIWFGISCYPGRAIACHVMLECGAVYRNAPLHALAWKEDCESVWNPSDAATWDAYGWQFSTLRYPFFSGMNGQVRLQSSQQHVGEYVFTLIPVGDGFSSEPSQSKEFYFFKLSNGRYTAQPTNRFLINDSSFVTKLEWPAYLRRQSGWHSSEL
jgi:hypothetical protein